MLVIRPLTDKDSIQDITCLLHRAYTRLGAMGLNYTAVDQTAEVTVKRIHGGQCYLAEWSGTLAGTIVVKPTSVQSECDYFIRPGVASVGQFGVEPSLQGQGIGRALLEICETWSKERGFRELALDTAEPAMHLVRLYENLGYSHVDFVQWTGKVYRSIVMSKALA